VTDFGVTVFDSAGQQAGQGPMNYPLARQVVVLDSARRGRQMTVELFPAFAHLEAPASWAARVRIAFLAAQPLRVERRQLRVEAGAEVDVPPLTSRISLPEGLVTLVRLTAGAGDGPPAVLQVPW
jgi:hypothetical protein